MDANYLLLNNFILNLAPINKLIRSAHKYWLLYLDRLYDGPTYSYVEWPSQTFMFCGLKSVVEKNNSESRTPSGNEDKR